MCVVIINPKLTIGSDLVAKAFHDTFRNELEEYTDVRCLKTTMHLHTTSIQPDEVVVIFNNKYDQEYSENVLGILSHALEIGCVVIPVSLFEQSRAPASIISRLQSFEVVDQLR